VVVDAGVEAAEAGEALVGLGQRACLGLLERITDQKSFTGMTRLATPAATAPQARSAQP
jgi:hypothetical protein